MNYTDEQILEKFESLPRAIADYLGDAETQKYVDSLCDEFAVPTNLQKDFRKQILLIAMGIIGTDEFVASMQQILRVDEDEAENILEAVDEDVLNAISVIIDEVKEEGETPDTANMAPGQQPLKTPNIDQNIIGEIELPPAPTEKTAPAPVSTTATSRVEVPKPLGVPRYAIPTTQPKPAAPVMPGMRPAPARPAAAPAPQTRVAGIPAKPSSILDAKLSGTTSMPSEEIDVSQQQKPRYTGTDPYRESIQ